MINKSQAIQLEASGAGLDVCHNPTGFKTGNNSRKGGKNAKLHRVASLQKRKIR